MGKDLRKTQGKRKVGKVDIKGWGNSVLLILVMLLLGSCQEHKLTGTKVIKCYGAGGNVVYQSYCATLSRETETEYVYVECDLNKETKITKPATCVEEYE